MAYVKMHQIKATVGRAIKYISRTDATQDGRLVTTNAAVIDPTDWRAVEAQFMATHAEKQGPGRKGEVLAHHVIQSFAPGEIADPDIAHEIGVKLAESITRGEHEYVVATHLDKGHFHNHIIVNAVSMESGRKLRVVKSTLATIRSRSDALCLERGLSVIEPVRDSVGQSLGQVYAQARGVSALDRVKVAIDTAVSGSRTWPQFEAALRSQGVEVGRSAKRVVTYRGFGMKRAAREIRLGAGYSEEQIMARLGRQSVLRFDVDQSMITGVARDSVKVKVPGTKGTRYLQINEGQVVRHGKTLRLYLPSEGAQPILDARGNIAAQVPTRALYAVFTPPVRDLIRVYGQRAAADAVRGSRGLRNDLARMHETESSLNARARYGVVNARQAIEQAAALDVQIESGLHEVQTLVVAYDEAAHGSPERADLAVRLSSAQARLADTQTSARALVKWAVEVDRDAEREVRQMTLKERLRGLSESDLTGVGMAPEKARELTEQVQRRQVVEQVEDEKPAEWGGMTLRERTQWLRERDRRQQQKQEQDREDSARRRRRQ